MSRPKTIIITPNGEETLKQIKAIGPAGFLHLFIWFDFNPRNSKESGSAQASVGGIAKN